jgi:hypothetical protein
MLAALLLSTSQLVWLLLAFFAWQFFHFQKQNLGIAALAARAHGAPGLTKVERASLISAGLGGIGGLLGRPSLLQLSGAAAHQAVFTAGLAVFAGALGAGCWALRRRPAAARPAPFVAAYVTGLLFFAPVWLFASPYAAVAGLTIAHGLQYLLLMGLLAARPSGGRGVVASMVILLDVAILLGLVLNRFSHLHGAAGPSRALFGVYLGLTAGHFVIDAGLWRLRDSFPRAFLTERLPFLLAPELR